MPGAHLVEVRGQEVAREGALRDVFGRRDGDRRRRRARQVIPRLRFLERARLVDDLDRDRRVGARLHAGGRLARRQPVGAHVALAHDAALAVELRHLVRAGEHAVLAADALVVEVADDAGRGILLVGLHRAAVHAGRVEAVMAGGRDRLLHGRLARTAVQEADAAPGLVVVEAVQAVAGGDAGLAPRAGVEVDAEAVLLAGGRPRERDQRLVAAGGRRVARLVALGEAFDRGQIPLFQQQLAHQKALCGRGHDPSTMRDRRWGYQGRMGFKLLKLLSFLETISRRSRNQPETRRARLLSAAD